MAANGDVNDVEMGLLENQNDEDFLNSKSLKFSYYFWQWFIVVELERLERRLRVERMVRTQLRQSKWELWGRRLTPAIVWLYRASVLLTLLLLLEQQEGKKVSRLSSAHGEYKLMAYDFRCTLAHIHWLRMYNDNTINTATLRLWQCN